MVRQSPSNLSAFVLQSLERIEPDFRSREQALAALLHISRNAAYKKLRGLSSFSVDDLTKVASHFRISLDAFLLQQNGYVPVLYPPFSDGPTTPISFIRSLDSYVTTGLKAPNARLWYATSEIPVFHYMYYRELTAFKLFIWQKTCWQARHLNDLLSLEAIYESREVDAVRIKIAEGYNQLHSIEFWPRHLLDHTLQQLEHMLVVGSAPDQLILHEVKRQLVQLVAHQSNLARLGKKGMPGMPPNRASFELYYNEIVHTGNMLLLESDLGAQAFFTLDNPNHMTTQDSRLCEQISAWFAQLSRLSQPISTHSEKLHGQFFKYLNKQLANY